MFFFVAGVLNIFSSCAQDFQPNIWSVDSGIHRHDFFKYSLDSELSFLRIIIMNKKLFWKMTRPTKL